MSPTLHNPAALEHQDLIRAADRRQAVRDDERRPAVAQGAQPVLDLGFALGIETRGRFVEHEDPRIGENRPGDRDALALAAGQLHAALADDRVVLVIELLDELVTVRDACHFLDLLPRRVRPGERDVLGDRAVEQEVVLQHHAELRAIIGQRHGREVAAIHEHASLLRPIEREHETDQCALAGSGRPDECGRRARGRAKRHVLEHRYARFIREGHVIERHVAAHRAERRPLRVFGILGGHAAQLINPVEPRECFGDLRADGRDVDQGQRDESHEKDVLDELPQRHGLCEDGASADENHDDRDRSDHELSEGSDARDASHRRRNIAEQPVRATREHQSLAALRPVRLHDANPSQRLGEPAGDLGVDLATLAEQRAQFGERIRHPAAEQREDENRHRRQFPVQPEQHAQRDRGGDESPDELHQPGAHQIPDALSIGHDARDEDPGLGRVEIRDGQAQHESLYGLPHVRDGALGGDPEDLRQPERGYRLDNRRHANRRRDHTEQVSAFLSHDLVDEIARRPRQYEPGEPADQHQQHTDREATPMLPDELPRFAPGVRIVRLGFLVRHGEKVT